jgi:Rhodopirellula transposase DDE domain
MYYSEELELEMLKFYTSLSEKDKRRYAAIEAQKLGHGGIKYISELFGCHRNTITEGKNELENVEAEKFNDKAIRAKGGGRKSCFEQIPELDQAFLSIVQNHTAGDPMQAEIKWTYMTQAQIAEELEKQEIEVSPPIVKQLLDKHNYVKRKAQKQLATGQTANRNEQFENIDRLKKEYGNAGDPIISIDTKKKSISATCIGQVSSTQPK